MFWNRKNTRKPRPQRQQPPRVRPQLEALEDRSVPATLVGLTSTDKLFLFDHASPTVIQRKVAITGLGAGEDMLSIDARPTSGGVYGLTNQNRLYTVNPYTGVATLLTAGAPAFNLQGNKVGIDFNPTVDRVRIVTNNAQNFRINPNSGALIDGDTGTGGTQPDTPLAYVDGNAGTDPKISAVAYDRNFQGATLTTLFAIDFGLDRLVRIGGVDGTPSPNGGQLTALGSLGVDASGAVGFEILASGAGLASFKVGDTTRLYTINLSSGAASSLGKIGDGTTRIDAITSLPREEIVYGTTALNRLISFRAGTGQAAQLGRAHRAVDRRGHRRHRLPASHGPALRPDLHEPGRDHQQKHGPGRSRWARRLTARCSRPAIRRGSTSTPPSTGCGW